MFSLQITALHGRQLNNTLQCLLISVESNKAMNTSTQLCLPYLEFDFQYKKVKLINYTLNQWSPNSWPTDYFS